MVSIFKNNRIAIKIYEMLTTRNSTRFKIYFEQGKGNIKEWGCESGTHIYTLSALRMISYMLRKLIEHEKAGLQINYKNQNTW